jgi:hypothetical protein
MIKWRRRRQYEGGEYKKGLCVGAREGEGGEYLSKALSILLLFARAALTKQYLFFY